jgi:hypothetical protein
VKRRIPLESLFLPLLPGEGGGEGPPAFDLRVALELRPEPGIRPGGRVTFFASPKKVTKERRPHCLRPSASLRATCGARFRRGPRKLAALKHARPFFRLKLRSSAQPEGRGAGTEAGTAFASLGELQVQQPKAQVRAMARWSSIPSGRAEERSFSRIRARDCLSEASSSETPRKASTAGCPQRSGGSRTVGSPSFAYFSWRDKKSESPAGANSRLRPHTKRNVRIKGPVPSPQPSPGGRGSKTGESA